MGDSSTGPIKVGDAAPDFTATTQEGTTVKLSQWKGSKAVVVFFYPRDFSPICTAQACAFRDSYQAFQDAGAVVLGISSDSGGTHDDFAKKNRLPFPLVSDEDGRLRALFGVPKALFVMPGRTTYVIDRAGIVRDVFTAHLGSTNHVEQAMTVVKQLAAA